MSRLYELLQQVEDRDSFLAFAAALSEDRADEVAKEKVNPSPPYSTGANGWENGSIESYLDAAVAWAKDHGVSESALTNTPTWRSFAEFLLAGKHYE